jgi:translation initiation factor 2B subunit (eIF-2B alpha/beta/delta family)
MFARYLSFALGGALVVFSIYHWLLVSDLTARLRAKDGQLAQHAEQIASLQAGQAALTKSIAEYKSQAEDQANELRLLQQAHEDAEKRLQLAAANAERRATACAKRPPTVQVIKEPDPGCVALKRALDLYIAQRLRQRGAAGAQN